MKQKKISRSVKRRLTIFGPVLSIVLVVCLVTIGTNLYNIYNLRQEKQNLENKLVDLKEKEDNLKDEIAKLKDPDYIAKYARENYYYSKSGEYVIKINEKDKNESVVIVNDTYKSYYIVSGVLLILIILILTLRIKKKKNK